MTRTNVWNRWRRRPATPQRLPFLPGIEPLEDRAVPATFTIRNLADSGPGSLRQAVLDANANKGADDIAFAPGLHGTITLKSGQLDLTDLTIDGPGAEVLAVSGNRVSRGCRRGGREQRRQRLRRRSLIARNHAFTSDDDCFGC